MSKSCPGKPHTFLTPRTIKFGSIQDTALIDSIAELGTRPLLVCSPSMRRLGISDQLSENLSQRGCAPIVMSTISHEPTVSLVNEGVTAFKAHDCNCVIGVGGGSPIDAAKAIALQVALSTPISQLPGVNWSAEACPIAAIPTTAGTGSEATQFTIITDESSSTKMLIAGSSLIPDLAIIDPSLCCSAPPHITASTGIDALCHAVESFTSRKSQPLSEGLAVSAVRRIFSNLALCYREPDNYEAHLQMSTAALEAGISFSNASVTIVHGMSRPLGARFGIGHGLSNALLAGTCLTFASQGAPHRFAQLAQYAGLSTSSDNHAAAQDLIYAINELIRTIGLPHLSECGINRSEFFAAAKTMARDAEKSGSPANTLREVSQEDMEGLYKQAYLGSY